MIVAYVSLLVREFNSLLFGKIEEGGDVGASVVGFEAFVVFFVAFCRVIAGVEGADVVEISASCFSEF